MKGYTNVAKHLQIAATLLTTSQNNISEKWTHNRNDLSSECFSTRKMSFTDKQNILKNKRCFLCLTLGHTTKQSKTLLKCLICNKKYASVVCQILDNNKLNKKKEEEKSSGNKLNMANFSRNSKVFLQTFKTKIISDNKKKGV